MLPKTPTCFVQNRNKLQSAEKAHCIGVYQQRSLQSIGRSGHACVAYGRRAYHFSLELLSREEVYDKSPPRS